LFLRSGRIEQGFCMMPTEKKIHPFIFSDRRILSGAV